MAHVQPTAKAGWKQTTLKDSTDLITCGVAARPEYVENGIPFLSAKNVKDGEVIWHDHKFVSLETHEKLTKHNKPQKGDILYTRVGSFGEAAIIESDIEFSIFVSLTLIKPKDFLLNTFLKYYLNSTHIKSLASRSISGSGVGNLNVGTVRKFPIPVPPLAEQERIVGILDEAFEGIAAAAAKAEKNLQNAREIFQSVLQSTFSQKGDDWVETTLGEVCENLDSKRIPITKNKRVAGEIPYYGASGIVDHVAEHIFDEDLLLVSEDGANLLARTYPIAFSISGKTWVNNHAHVLKFEDLAAQHFMEFYLNSIKLDPYVSGMAQPKLNQKSLNSIPVPSPPLPTQQAIVEKLDALSEETKRLEAIYERKQAALTELKQSLLQKAFAGEL
jgi:type I restriction enzyme S subunit